MTRTSISEYTEAVRWRYLQSSKKDKGKILDEFTKVTRYHRKKQYLGVLRERYLRAKAKKEKSQILDEYCRNTGQARKYVIRKIQPGVELRPKPRKKRKQTYDGQATAALAKLWEIFD